MARAREDVGARLARNFVVEGGCWIWTGSKTRDGYGVIVIGRKQYRAHRVAYENCHGTALTPADVICHKCDTPLCVNPRHLFKGTARDNTRDMIAKGRKVVMTDGLHPNTKIPHEQRDVIRAMRQDGASLRGLANAFGVSFKTISAICTRANNYAKR